MINYENCKRKKQTERVSLTPKEKKKLCKEGKVTLIIILDNSVVDIFITISANTEY